MAEENCWSDKTPLEIGLLLILFVTTPILIALLLAYILLPILCADCSIACSKVCGSSSSSKPVPPPAPAPTTLPPSDSAKRQFYPSPRFSDERTIKLESNMDVCPYDKQIPILLRDVNLDIHSAFIASVIENVYEDDSARQRYLCAAAIVTYKWVITGSTCFKSERNDVNPKHRIFVRAGSNFWSKGGSIHEARHILFANNNPLLATVAAIKLMSEFPKLMSITSILLSSTMSLRRSSNLIEMYDWKTNNSMLMPLMFRKKYVALTKEQLTVLPDSECNLYTKNENLFCATPVAEKVCSNYSYMSFPVTKTNILLGINFGKICNTVNNITVYLIFDTPLVLSWLKNITQT